MCSLPNGALSWDSAAASVQQVVHIRVGVLKRVQTPRVPLKRVSSKLAHIKSLAGINDVGGGAPDPMPQPQAFCSPLPQGAQAMALQATGAGGPLLLLPQALSPLATHFSTLVLGFI